MQLLVNIEGVLMGPTQGPYILLLLCMGLSYFLKGLAPPDPPLFRTLGAVYLFPVVT